MGNTAEEERGRLKMARGNPRALVIIQLARQNVRKRPLCSGVGFLAKKQKTMFYPSFGMLNRTLTHSAHGPF